jgi:hypothetical protein
LNITFLFLLSYLFEVIGCKGYTGQLQVVFKTLTSKTYNWFFYRYLSQRY